VNLELVNDPDGYTHSHECFQITTREPRSHSVDLIAKKDGKWWAVCEDQYFTDEIFYCPFCGVKL
jgi:hypothetical protein